MRIKIVETPIAIEAWISVRGEGRVIEVWALFR